ncbi:MAG: hypothetical protein M3P95_03050 [Actinomycetota bacterium]|nr:hypothetical protein [Actinomycetota bacterium]
MLAAVGLTDVEQLFDPVPPDLRLPAGRLTELGVPDGVSEAKVLRRARRLAGRVHRRSFLLGGCRWVER